MEYGIIRLRVFSIFDFPHTLQNVLPDTHEITLIDTLIVTGYLVLRQGLVDAALLEDRLDYKDGEKMRNLSIVLLNKTFFRINKILETSMLQKMEYLNLKKFKLQGFLLKADLAPLIMTVNGVSQTALVASDGDHIIRFTDRISMTGASPEENSDVALFGRSRFFRYVQKELSKFAIKCRNIKNWCKHRDGEVPTIPGLLCVDIKMDPADSHYKSTGTVCGQFPWSKPSNEMQVISLQHYRFNTGHDTLRAPIEANNVWPLRHYKCLGYDYTDELSPKMLDMLLETVCQIINSRKDGFFTGVPNEDGFKLQPVVTPVRHADPREHLYRCLLKVKNTPGKRIRYLGKTQSGVEEVEVSYEL